MERKRALNLREEDMKHVKEILKLAEVVNSLIRIVIMHCPGNQKDGSQTSR